MQLFALEIATFFPFAIFGCIAALLWFLLDMFSAKKPRSEERLEKLRDPSARTAESSQTFASVLGKATPALAKLNQPTKEKEISKLKQKLSYAGFRSDDAPTMYLGLKMACLLTGAMMGGGWAFLQYGVNMSGLMRFIVGAGLMFYLPEVILGFISRRRKEAIFLGLPDALDLMVVCVEAGLALDQAMRKVAEEMKKTHPTIAEEFGLCNMQLQMGLTRSEVLHELGQRTGVDDLRQLASVLIQADKFGSSIATALRVQSESMRTRRRQIAEEKAAKTAVQLIFPLILFIFPSIFVVLVGPAAIQMIREMMPAMKG